MPYSYHTFYQKPQQNGGGVRPSQQGRPKNKPQQTRPVQKRPQKQNYPKRPQTSRPVNNNRQQQSGNQGSSQGGALGAPSVMCPSAMLCVPKPNCDFKGLITDIPLNNLSPELEALRVPYIVSKNYPYFMHKVHKVKSPILLEISSYQHQIICLNSSPALTLKIHRMQARSVVGIQITKTHGQI